MEPLYIICCSCNLHRKELWNWAWLTSNVNPSGQIWDILSAKFISKHFHWLIITTISYLKTYEKGKLLNTSKKIMFIKECWHMYVNVPSFIIIVFFYDFYSLRDLGAIFYYILWLTFYLVLTTSSKIDTLQLWLKIVKHK